MPSLVEIGPVVLEKMKLWKVYRRTDDGRKVIKIINTTPYRRFTATKIYVDFINILLLYAKQQRQGAERMTVCLLK